MKPILNLIFIISTATCFGQITIDSGLVAFYPFCGNADDFSDSNNDGTYYLAIKANGNIYTQKIIKSK